MFQKKNKHKVSAEGPEKSLDLARRKFRFDIKEGQREK